MDRISGFVALIMLGFFGIIITNSNIFNYSKILSIYLFFLLSILFILFLFNEKIVTKIKKLYCKMQSNDNYEQINKTANKVINLIFAYKGAYKTLGVSLFYGLLFQAVNTLSTYFLVLSIGLNLNFIDLLWINALVSIIIATPITILGLGLREGSFVYLLGLLGILNIQALSFSLLASFVYFAGGLIGGVFELYEFIFIEKIKKYVNKN